MRRYRASYPSAGACHTIDVALKPACGRAARLSSMATATGSRWASSGVVSTPSRSAANVAAVGAGEGEGVGVGGVVAMTATGAAGGGEGGCTGTLTGVHAPRSV